MTTDTPTATKVISVLVPIKAASLNVSGAQTHWGQRASRAKKHREAVGWMLAGHKPVLPCVVTMCRVAPSNGLDSDNSIGSMKHARDGVATWLGADDNDPRIEWRYSQERGKTFGVRVTIESALP